jgi:hypothetical protein
MAHQRVKAWSKLLEEAPTRGATGRIAVATEACQTARSGLAVALGALDAGVEGGSHHAVSREWVACLDDILAIADRACAMLAATGQTGASAPWPVWESQATG